MQIKIKVSTSWHYRFLIEVARHVQITKSTSIVMQNIQIFYGGPVMFIVTCLVPAHPFPSKLIISLIPFLFRLGS